MVCLHRNTIWINTLQGLWRWIFYFIFFLFQSHLMLLLYGFCTDQSGQDVRWATHPATSLQRIQHRVHQAEDPPLPKVSFRGTSCDLIICVKCCPLSIHCCQMILEEEISTFALPFYIFLFFIPPPPNPFLVFIFILLSPFGGGVKSGDVNAICQMWVCEAFWDFSVVKG